MTQFFCSWYASRRQLEIKDDDIDDTAVRVSTKRARNSGLLHTQFVWVQYRKTRRAFCLRHSEQTEDGAVYMSRKSQRNLTAQTGSQVYLRKAELPTIDSITLYPLSSTISLEGRLISDYVNPYFSSGIYPMHVKDVIDICPELLTICVTALDGNEFGVVTPETKITLVKRAGEYRFPGYSSINDALECLFELRRNIDYVSSEWCAESLAEFAGGLQRTIDLLENPPTYENAMSKY